MEADLPLIPFGKLKGKDITHLLNDHTYCEWVVAQPWFKEKHSRIYNIVVNRNDPSKESTPTPEHNRIQNLFLKTDFQYKLIQYLGYLRNTRTKIEEDTLKDNNWVYKKFFPDKWWSNVNVEIEFEAENNWDIVMEFNKYSVIDIPVDIKYIEGVIDKIVKYERINFQNFSLSSSYKNFISENANDDYNRSGGGWDFFHSVERYMKIPKMSQKDFDMFPTGFKTSNETISSFLLKVFDDLKEIRKEYPKIKMFNHYIYQEEGQLHLIYYKHYESLLKIEIKPQVGDDYPVILRKMKAQQRTEEKCSCLVCKCCKCCKFMRCREHTGYECNKKSYRYVLLIGKFVSDVTSCDELSQIFNQSKISIIFLEDIQNTIYDY